MARTGEIIPVSLPGLRATRWRCDGLYSGMKEYYAIARIELGRAEWWGRGRIWQSRPGVVQAMQPGDVHRDLVKDGPMVCQIVVLPALEIERVREEGRAVAHPHLDPGDERAAPFHRLFDAIQANADRLSLEVALAEAVSAFAIIGNAPLAETRPVRRAMAYLREQYASVITLDDLADFAGLDKFHLCRAFRAQIGMPPHAYLTHLRVSRAKELLDRGVRASEIAPLVGLYDQSQLNRHFRRIVGTTPGRYGNTRPRPSITT